MMAALVAGPTFRFVPELSGVAGEVEPGPHTQS